MAKNVKCALPAKPSPVWIAVALAVVTLAVYGPVTSFQFVKFDDPDFVTENPHVQAGLTLQSIQWAWSSEVMGNWHPVTMLSHMLDCQLFGVQPWWPHLVNALLHAANAALLFALLRRMTGALWRSAIVAALFALHPLHVESVAWVSERKDVLSTLFWFLTTWAFLRYAEDCKVQNAKRRIFYGLSLLFFAIGLMCKPMLVTLPCTLLLLDYWPLARMKAGPGVWRLAAEKIPFFALSVALCVVTFRVQKHTGAVSMLQNLPLGYRVGNALVSYALYIEKMFWPSQLAGLYLFRPGQWPGWQVALAAVALLAISGLVLAQWRRRPYLAAGWCWYVGTLVPVIGLVQVGSQSMADRYTYIPLIGLFVMLVWGGWELAGAWRLARFAPAATAVALAACAAVTAHQEFFWKNSEAYNKRIIDVTPDNYIGRNNLGSFYLDADKTNEAMTNLLVAVQENPHYPAARYNLGSLYLKENRTEEGISNLMEAVKEDPNFAEAHNNLASVFLRQQRFDEAIEHFRAAARLYPHFFCFINLADALEQMANARHDTNALAEAARDYQQALQFNPASSVAHHNLGRVLQALGRGSEAVPEFEQAARLDPNWPDTWVQLGLACAMQSKMPEAEQAFRQLIRLQPGNADAFRWAGDALMAQNKPADAIQFYLTALKLNPSDSRTEHNLAWAQKALREMESPTGKNR